MINFATVNARSIMPKIKSFVNMSNNLKLDFCLINETWLSDKTTSRENISDIELGNNIGLIHRNRVGRRGGGVAITYDCQKLPMRELPLSFITGSKCEGVAAISTQQFAGRKIIAVSVYVPPNLLVHDREAVVEAINDEVLSIRSQFDSPLIVMAWT